jgi:hypothetical protein
MLGNSIENLKYNSCIKKIGKEMRKILLFGIILVITLLFLVPSMPAIQQKIIYNEVEREMIEDYNIKNIKKYMEFSKTENIKFPLLYKLIISTLTLRWFRINVLREYSYEEDWPYYEIKNPILFFRFLILLINTHIWSNLWSFISHNLGWNWDIPY